MFWTVDVLEVDVLEVDVLEVDALEVDQMGRPRKKIFGGPQGLKKVFIGP
jgi:hypothetical protein